MLSPTVLPALQRLAASTEALLAILQASRPDRNLQRQCDEVASVITGHLTLLNQALLKGDARLALRGANALMTVNKAVADFSDGSDQMLEDASAQLSRDAIAAGKLLRAEIGFL